MATTLEDVIALEALDEKLRAILPASYGDSYADLLPTSMGSAGLKYGPDGRVAWDEIWATFCDLAMAGGPPHRGTLLEPATTEEVAADRDGYDRTVEEIGRGVTMVTGLSVRPVAAPGWIGVECSGAGMAGWLVRAIVMENVLARHDQATLYLPAGPKFRLIKEVKNVVTVTAKTCHYWMDHTPAEQKVSIAAMLENTAGGMELLDPATPDEIHAGLGAYREVADAMTRRIGRVLGLPCFPHRYPGWIGFECPNVPTAVWMIRALVVENVLARREAGAVFVPVHPRFAEGSRCDRLVHAFTHAFHLSRVKKLS